MSVKLSPNHFLSICFIIYAIIGIYSQTVYVQNLNEQCLRCLCFAATNCNVSRGCIEGYCGPYKVSRLYWKDANYPVLPDDDPQRAGAFEDCALNYHCSQRMVTNYMARFGKDCNEDGVTNCDDYLMINFNGGWQCSSVLSRNEFGRDWITRYRRCSPSI